MESILIIGDMVLWSMLRDYFARQKVDIAIEDGLTVLDAVQGRRLVLILRSRTTQPIKTRRGKPARKLSVHGFDLDVYERTARYRSTRLALTDTEFALLQALLESPGVVLRRDYLTDRILRRPFSPSNRGLDMLVSRLRRKLEIEDNPGVAIRTIRSCGYVFLLPRNE